MVFVRYQMLSNAELSIRSLSPLTVCISPLHCQWDTCMHSPFLFHGVRYVVLEHCLVSFMRQPVFVPCLLFCNGSIRSSLAFSQSQPVPEGHLYVSDSDTPNPQRKSVTTNDRI